MPARGNVNWMAYAAGPWGNWALVAANDGRLRVEAYLDSGDAGLNKTLFDELHADASSWEAKLGYPLSWERLDDKRASRLAAYHPVGDLADDTERAQLRDWAVETVLALYDGMNELLRARARELRHAAKMQEPAPEARPTSAAPPGLAPPDGTEPAEPRRDGAAGPATGL